MNRYAVIGAGPSGLSAARALQKQGIEVDGYEASHGVGGLWDITNPRSSMYESAHLISSRTTTEFAEFPMRSDADYPSHRVLRDYFQSYADHFGLTALFRFDTHVTRLEPADGGWNLTAAGPDGCPVARRHRRLSLPESRPHVVLRQQGRLPRRRAHRARPAGNSMTSTTSPSASASASTRGTARRRVA